MIQRSSKTDELLVVAATTAVVVGTSYLTILALNAIFTASQKKPSLNQVINQLNLTDLSKTEKKPFTEKPETFEMLKTALKTPYPPILIGPPGAGKTATVEYLAHHPDYENVMILRVSAIDLTKDTKYAGTFDTNVAIPFVNEETV